MKGILSLLFMGLIIQLFNVCAAKSVISYDYYYETPSKQSIATNGHFIISSSRCVYSPSRSKLINKYHRDRITAYNYKNGNY